MAKKKFYAVAIGNVPGIYETWAECEIQTKGFRGARFKSFSSKGSAQEFIEANVPKESASVRTAKRSRPPFFSRLKIDIHFDGGSRGSSGASGAGAHVEIVTELKDGSLSQQTVDVRKYLGNQSTNNIAEYHGLLCGLREAKKAVMEFRRVSDDDGVSLKCVGDSDLVIQQMNGTYQCKSENLIPLYREAKCLVREMEEVAPMEVSFVHVYRKENSVADALANEAMSTGRSWITMKGDVDNYPSCSRDGKSAVNPAEKMVRTGTDLRDV